MVLWFQGCLFECPGCHNPNTWPIDGGSVYDIDEIIKEIKNHTHHDGITLSGGDPMFQVNALKVLLPKIKQLDLNVWLYSGDTFENLIKDNDFLEISKYIDVLVDGRFIKSLFDFNLDYRGSSNQRIIDVKESIKQNKTILHKIKNR